MRKTSKEVRLTVVVSILAIVDICLLISAILSRPTSGQSKDTPINASGETLYTYKYMEAHGNGVGMCGQTIDGIHHIRDEVVFIGPYLEKPNVQIPIFVQDTHYVVETEKFNGFSCDVIEGVYDGSKEQRAYPSDDTIMQCGLVQFEDGEIYIYINFLQNIENLGGSSYAADELVFKPKEERTVEEQKLVDTYYKLHEKAMQDRCLYSHREFFNRSDEYTSVIQYSPDHTSVVGYNPEKWIKYDYSQHH